MNTPICPARPTNHDELSAYLLDSTAHRFASAIRGRKRAPPLLVQLGLGAVPRLIQLDLNMPVVNGWESLTAYQHLPPVTHYRLLVLLSR